MTFVLFEPLLIEQQDSQEALLVTKVLFHTSEIQNMISSLSSAGHGFLGAVGGAILGSFAQDKLKE